MILMIMFLIMTIVGFVMIKLDNDDLESIGIAAIIVGFICLILSVIAISMSNFTADLAIQNNRIEYEGLCKRLEIINSEYENVSKSDVIADITGWNMMVYETKYWSYNPWTNWFNPKRIADDLNYISINGEEEE